MSLKTRYLTLLAAVLAGLFVLAVVLTTCSSPFGFGEAIDFEPPVLTLEGRTTRYVKRNHTLQGTVTDNIMVDRVIIRDAETQREETRFTVIVSGDTWRSDMVFTDADDGKKWALEVVAYDHAGNSGDVSIKAVSLIIDISDPVVDDLWIQRTSKRIAYLSSLRELRELENGPANRIDRNGEQVANVNTYQNGWFWMDARLTEEQTSINKVKLQIYDSRYPDTPLFPDGPEDEGDVTEEPGEDDLEEFKGRTRLRGTSVTAPRWLLKEEKILEYGRNIWGQSYVDNYYNGQRYYYQVVILSHDDSFNEGRWRVEDQSHFVMWERGDIPKAIVDPIVVGTRDEESGDIMITKGEILPIEFFDDDAMNIGYAALFTKEQWEGFDNNISETVYLGTDTTTTGLTLKDVVGDEAKRNKLRQWLTGGQTIYDWTKDKWKDATPALPFETVEERFGFFTANPTTPDEKTFFIRTGTKDSDYGEFVLFTLVGDVKGAPHERPYTGNQETLQDRMIARSWPVQIVDDNQPLIVIDTMDIRTGSSSSDPVAFVGSPEENTFPHLKDGRFFTIRGYTLRQSNDLTATGNSVENLRLAWVPFGEGDSASEQADKVTAVRRDLKKGFPAGINPIASPTLGDTGVTDPVTGIRYWLLTLDNDDHHPVDASIQFSITNQAGIEQSPGGLKFIRFNSQSTSWYRKQFFSKTFDLLGGSAAGTVPLSGGSADLLPNSVASPSSSSAGDVYVSEPYFVYNNKLENKTKQFVFAAQDNMGHAVDRQHPILGRITPPKLTVYDISDRVHNSVTLTGLPKINEYDWQANGGNGNGTIDPGERINYQNALRAFNILGAEHGPPVVTGSTFDGLRLIFESGTGDRKEANSLQIYPRGKTLKYFVIAEEDGNLHIDRISMVDMFSGSTVNLGNNYSKTMLSYVEFLPEVDRKMFSFTAYDTLGNENIVRRAVTISSTSILSEITSPRPDGTYGISTYAVNKYLANGASNTAYSEASEDRIVIQARFSSMVQWEGNDPPLLNVRYKRKNPDPDLQAPANDQFVLRQIPTITPKGTQTLFLEFMFKVPEGAAPLPGTLTPPMVRGDYELQTMYDPYATQANPTVSGHPLYVAITEKGDGDQTPLTTTNLSTVDRTFINRPITLPTGTSIMDVSHEGGVEVAAFVPGYESDASRMETWKDSSNSLQGGDTAQTNRKDIFLDGIRPYLVPFVTGGHFMTVDGKAPNPDPGVVYYFKRNETIEFRLKANTRVQPYTVQPAGSTISPLGPRIQFYIQGTGTNPTGPYYAVYQGSANSGTELIFTFPFGAPGSSVSPPYSNSTGFAVIDGSIVTNHTNSTNNLRLNTLYGGIETQVGNAIRDSVNTGGIVQTTVLVPNNDFAPANARTPLPAGTIVRFDQTAPNAPATTLTPTTGTAISFTGTTNPVTESIHRFNLSMQITPSTNEPNGVTTQYSLNGGSDWITYTGVVPTSSIGTGIKNIRTRCIDMAGNEGDVSSRNVEINVDFPRLVAISAQQPNGTYKGGDSLKFNLTFEANVWTATGGTVSITLSNRSTGTPAATATVVLTATAITEANQKTTVEFEWNNITNKEMRNGLYVSAVNFSGLRDRFGNPGSSGTATYSGADGTGTATWTTAAITGAITGDEGTRNLNGAGLIVDAIPPEVSARSPANNGVIPGTDNSRNRTLTITFSEPVTKGSSGTIVVRPRGNYSIPPVFRNEGYYLGTNGQEYSSPSAAPSGVFTTYVDGFYDVYNRTTTAAQRTTLTQSQNDTMENLALNNRTGNSAGPYKRMTHGLKEGSGYSGTYSQTTPGANGPSHDNTLRMVPDTSTKWVLDYQYLIDNTTANSAVTNIRTTLTAIKFRWQEFDVSSSNVSIGTGANTNLVTINLPEPLLDGLEWELYYPVGTFTDIAGNNAPVLAAGSYGFWSSGVQAPVIRVNRRSFDARTSNWQSTSRTYNVPGNTANWNTNGIAITDSNGWGITDFNVVHYRIESETPGAAITSGIYEGSNNAAIGAWTGTVQAANPSVTSIANANWNDALTAPANAGTTNENGKWILANLIYRAGRARGAQNAGTSGNDTLIQGLSYTVQQNGVTITMQQTGVRADWGGPVNYQGFRSYNQDPTKSNLESVSLSSFNDSNRQGRITYSVSTSTPSYEARKSYVVAMAAGPNGGTARGYEGVFRSVVMLNQNSYGGWVNNPRDSMYLVEGSNVKNGMPSIAGFPVRDAEETGDNRFVKVFHYTADGNGGRFFWVSTEIVSSWYQLTYGQTHNATGEVNNYLSAGYGDLTYSYNQR